MRFAAVNIVALVMTLAVYAAPPVVDNLPDGGTVTPELPCNSSNYVNYIEKCTAQLEGGKKFTVENFDKCMEDAGCPAGGEN